MAPTGAERKVPRSGAWTDIHVCRVAGDQDAFAVIQNVDDYAVLSQVGHVRQPVVRVQVDGVGMSAVLALRVDTRTFAQQVLVLYETGRRLQASVTGYWRDAYAAAVVVGGQQKFAGRVYADVTRSGTARTLTIDVSERPCLVIDLVGVQRALHAAVELPDLGCGVQKSPIRMQREERRVLRAGSNRHRLQRSDVWIESTDVDTLGGRSCIGADENEWGLLQVSHSFGKL